MSKFEANDFLSKMIRIALEHIKGGYLRAWNNRSRPASCLLWMCVLTCLLTVISLAVSQRGTIPENPLRGRLVFEQKGCSQCHSMNGKETGIGPDLGQEKFYGSYMELASVMWNHSPLMLRRMHELELPYPRLSSAEMSELIAYIYYQRFLGERGDLYRGKLLVQEKNCLSCHSIAGKGADIGPAFDQLARFASPLYMAQALWNHGPAMAKELQKQGIELPRFEEGEIVDLSAYIREASAQSEKERVYMAPGNPNQGRQVLAEKQCLNCHSLDGRGGSEAIDFGEVEWRLSVSEIAALMWNHSSEMQQLMFKKNMRWPEFRGHEMADLISFLYFLGFQGDTGNPTRGEELFREKGCIQCHSWGESSESPSLPIRHTTPSHLAASLWNHAPAMEHRVAETSLPWPRLDGQSMADLSAYIQEVSRTRDGP